MQRLRPPRASRSIKSSNVLATPLAEIDLKEASGCGIWTLARHPHPHIDASLYRFLLEMQFGITVSLHRDFMGPSFAAQELHVTYGAPRHRSNCPDPAAALLLKVNFGEWCRELMVLHRELHSSAIIRAAEHGETIHHIVGEVESQVCVIGKMGIVGKLIGVAVTFDDLIERDARLAAE